MRKKRENRERERYIKMRKKEKGRKKGRKEREILK